MENKVQKVLNDAYEKSKSYQAYTNVELYDMLKGIVMSALAGTMTAQQGKDAMASLAIMIARSEKDNE